MIQKILLGFAALVALTAIVASAVVAAAFALYAGLRGLVGPGGAAALVALAGFLLVGAAALAVGLKTRPSPSKDQPLSARLMDMARERPVLAAAAVAIAGVVAVRNPKVLTTAVSAFLAGRTANKN